MDEEAKTNNALIGALRQDPLSRAQKQLAELRDHWIEHGVEAQPVPLVPRDSSQPYREWFPQPKWFSGWAAFGLLRLQEEPYTSAPAIAQICVTISDQTDREMSGLNYVIGSAPPTHELLKDFVPGSNHWFRALHILLTIDGAEGADGIEGWEAFVSDLDDWIGPFDNLRIRTMDVLDKALTLSWHYHDISLPEAKQEPVWHFPRAMAWIATRDYLALARVGHFRRHSDNEEPVATEGVCIHNTRALGWLHTLISYNHCSCGALREFGLEAYHHCTCISVAWEELVRFNGGLSPETPELVFSLQEGWLSMTWPEGAEDIRFLRRDILDRWPPLSVESQKPQTIEHSTAAGEQDCRGWLAKEFAADPEKRRSKRDFREAALAKFPGRLSERGFNLRVWPGLAREHARDGAGAKRKS